METVIICNGEILIFNRYDSITRFNFNSRTHIFVYRNTKNCLRNSVKELCVIHY